MSTKDHPPEYRHFDDMDWELIRFQGEDSKLIFHTRPERPSEPNAGLVRYEPGCSHPRHRHDFAQIWYIIEGEFLMGGKIYGPGTVIYYPDPHDEDELSTETGGLMFFVQYIGPHTGKGPVYAGHFGVPEVLPLKPEDLDE